MKIDNTVQGIRKAIKSVCNRAKTLQDDIQQVAIATLAHTVEHGDWTLSVELVDGLSQSNGVKKAKLVQYFEAMMGASFGRDANIDRNVFEYDEGKNASTIDLDIAKAVKWYDFKVEGKDTSKTLEEIMRYVHGQLAKSLKSGKVTESQCKLIDEFFEAMTDEGVELEVVETQAA